MSEPTEAFNACREWMKTAEQAIENGDLALALQATSEARDRLNEAYFAVLNLESAWLDKVDP